MATEEIPQDGEEVETDMNTMLIHLVKEHSYIYDATDPNYKDRDLLERTWSSIASQINLSVQEAKTKWQRLRNNFSKAIERRGKTPRSGSAATKLQKPWAYEEDMEFVRIHLQHHRPGASSSSLKRQAPAAYSSQSLSPQPGISYASEQTADTTRMSDTSSMGSSAERDACYAAYKNPKARKPDLNQLDSAVLSFMNESCAKRDQEEDPAVGWFKSLLPMYNTLSSIEKLEFQSKVTLELRSFLLAKEQRIAQLSMPPTSTSPSTSRKA